MTKDVILTISGLQIEPLEGESAAEPIEVMTPASYYYKNGKHYVLYDEVQEGMPGVTRNKVKITGDTMIEIIKSGLLNAHMVFEKGKQNLTNYETPFGQIVIGVNTTSIDVEEDEHMMKIKVDYALDMNHEFLADCKIRMSIRSKDAGFSIMDNLAD